MSYYPPRYFPSSSHWLAQFESKDDPTEEEYREFYIRELQRRRLFKLEGRARLIVNGEVVWDGEVSSKPEGESS